MKNNKAKGRTTMRVIEENNFSDVFPMKIKCRRVVDEYGFSYGNKVDFCGSELEVDAEDIKKHEWFKYPDYKGIDYGVICPVCGKFTPVYKKSLSKMIMEKAESIRVA